ncbi:MAG: ATP-dependent DNA helicase [Clostridia bacterium]|nr:ATP-dependent DNA helicase [Clostridia bacterium]
MNKKLIKVAVKDLVSFSVNKGNIEKKGSFSMIDSAYEGTAIHSYFQKKMVDLHGKEKFTKEQYLAIKVENEIVSLDISGRIDGLLIDEKVTIYEVKTTLRDVDHIDPEEYVNHWGQAFCYGYIYGIQNDISELDIVLIYINRENDQEKSFQITYTIEQLKEIFDQYANNYLNWMSTQTKWLQIRNISAATMEFPFTDYRAGQRELAAKVFRAIRDEERLYVTAPTGIGKTMGTLFPAIKALGEGLVDRIFYLTAKTVTAKVAMQAYKILNKNGLNLRTLVITAKDKVCPYEVRNCDPLVCEKARGYYERMPHCRKELLKEQYFDRETINKYASIYNICPFELSLDTASYSDLIICDYNYLFDPRIKLQRFFIDVNEKYCFLVDEAHNLVDRGRSMYSAEIVKSEILMLRRKTNPTWMDVKKRLANVNKEMNTIKKDCFDMKSEDYYMENHIPAKLVTEVRRLATVMEKYFDYEMDAEYQALFLDLYFKLYYFSKVSEFYDVRYKSFYQIKGSDMSVKLMCLDPSHLLSKAMDCGICTTLFSATLEPKSYYMDILGGREFDKSISLYSPFPSENFKVIVEGRISTKYKDRDMTYTEIAQLLKEAFSRQIGNYIVYFPSYRYLNSVMEIYREMVYDVEIMVQKQGMDEIEREIFLERFDDHGEKTLVAFAVMGGIFGEGIDLEGEKLNGVVIIGTGIPMICPENEMIKDYYDRIDNKGFDYSYTYPGINRVLQAAGRVIRTENDRGFVILVDSRFAGAKYRRLFPPWWEIEYFTQSNKKIHNSLSTFYSI